MTPGASPLIERRRGRPGEPAMARRMVAVTWIQHRSALLAFSVLAAAAALVLIVAGMHVGSVYAALPSCPPGEGKCLGDTTLFTQKPWDLYPGVMSAVLVVLVLLFGVFLAAPLLAAEFESGTFRFAWTQAVDRRAWLTWKLALLGGSWVLLAAGLGALFSWSYRPWDLTGAVSGWTGLLFQASPLTLAGWAFLAVTLGTLIGVATRRTVPAMAWTGIALLAAVAAAWWQTARFLGLATSSTVAAPAPASGVDLIQGPLGQVAMPGPGRLSGAWLVRGWFTGRGGNPLSPAAVRQLNGSDRPLRWLSRHHAEYHLAYHPASALGAFQGVQALLLVIAGLLCLGFMYRIVAVRRMRERHPRT